MLDNESYESLLKFVYEMQNSALEEDHIPFYHQVLLQIYQIIGLRHLTFSMVNGHEMNLIDSLNINSSIIEKYVGGMYKYDVFHPSNLPSTLVKKPLVDLEDIIPYAVFERSQYYQLMGQNMYYRAILPLADEKRLVGMIGILKTKEEGPFTKEEVFFLGNASPFLSSLYKYSQKRKDLPFTTMDKIENTIIRRAKIVGLTSRETDVTILIAKGFTNNQISEMLNISPHTTKTHIENIFLKTGTNRRITLINLLLMNDSPVQCT